MKAVSERLKSALSEMQSRPAGGIRASGKAEGGKPEADAFRSAVQSGLSKVGRSAASNAGRAALNSPIGPMVGGAATAVPASVARALIGGLKHDLPAHDAELRRLVPQKLLSFRKVN